MKNNDLDLSALENADENITERLAGSYEALDSTEKEKLFAMSFRKFTGEAHEKTAVDDVSGVDTYRRPVWRTVLSIASVLMIAAAVGAGGAAVMKKTSISVNDNEITAEDASLPETSAQSVTQETVSAVMLTSPETAQPSSAADVTTTTSPEVSSTSVSKVVQPPVTTQAFQTQSAPLVTTTDSSASSAVTTAPSGTSPQPVRTTSSVLTTTSATVTEKMPATTAPTAEVQVMRDLTLSDVLRLSMKGDALSWDDLRWFNGYDMFYGRYGITYPIAGRDDLSLIVTDDPITKAELRSSDGRTSPDIRSDKFREMNMLNCLLPWWGGAENNAENQADARVLGAYMLDRLKSGASDTDLIVTAWDFADKISPEMYEIMRKGNLTGMKFLDEHTVMILMHGSGYYAYGYLFTDGTVTYSVGESADIPGIGSADDRAGIKWAEGSLAYFVANTEELEGPLPF